MTPALTPPDSPENPRGNKRPKINMSGDENMNDVKKDLMELFRTPGSNNSSTPGSGSTNSSWSTSVEPPSEAALDAIMEASGIPIPNSCKKWTEEQKEAYARARCKQRAICKAWGACPRTRSRRKSSNRRKTKYTKKCPKCSPKKK